MQEDQIPQQVNQSKDEQELQNTSAAYPLPLMEFEVLTGTIAADLTSNMKFIRTHFKVTLWLLLAVLILKILPSPLIIRTFDNDPSVFTKQTCSESDIQCANMAEGFESIVIKKINPLQRELKYFIRLNQAKMGEFTQAFGSKVDLNKEITWIEIYATRNNEIYGEVIYQKSGEDAYEIIFNNEPLIYIGEVHILSEVSYLIRIYKLIHKYKTKPVLRFLEEDKSTRNSTQNQENHDPVPTDDKKQPEQKEISVPLTVELVRYSQFYTGTELLIRYITFLFILYVRAETANCPKIFHAIIFFTANPLIFTEIAFPNTASNILSSMCSSMYIFYIPIFLYYTHRRLSNARVDLAVRLLKLLGSIGLYIASIIRSLHLMNQTFVQTIQYLLIVAIMIPFLKYLWRMYFIRSKVVLHRNMLFVILTIYYFSLLFFSGYIVEYGWKKISFYLIVQAYGVALCYLTTPKPYNEVPNQNVTTLSPNARQEPLSMNSRNANSIQIQANSDPTKEKQLMEQCIESHFVNIQ